MNVNEESSYPLLKEENLFLRDVLRNGIPLLGISQVAGGAVCKGKGEEIGWYPVTLTEEGEKDLRFKGFPKLFAVFRWHEDTFEIPSRGKIDYFRQLCKAGV
jgi:GMP synthase-like glutamine amidotransferase